MQNVFWHLIFLCWYQLFLLHLLAAKRIFNVILAVIHWQRSDMHLGKITESFSYYSYSLGMPLKWLITKHSQTSAKIFGGFYKRFLVYSTHMHQSYLLKDPVDWTWPYPLLHKEFPPSRVCSGICSQHRAACWDFLPSPFLQKCGGAQARKQKGWTWGDSIGLV